MEHNLRLFESCGLDAGRPSPQISAIPALSARQLGHEPQDASTALRSAPLTMSLRSRSPNPSAPHSLSTIARSRPLTIPSRFRSAEHCARITGVEVGSTANSTFSAGWPAGKLFRSRLMSYAGPTLAPQSRDVVSADHVPAVAFSASTRSELPLANTTFPRPSNRMCRGATMEVLEILVADKTPPDALSANT